MPKNAIQNFQIPVKDFERALKFYSTVLGYELQTMEFGGAKLALFAYDAEAGGVGGTLIQADGMKPAADGTLVYLHVEDLETVVSRIEAAGGQVVQPKTTLGPSNGYFALANPT